MRMTNPPTFVVGFHNEDAVRKMPYRPLGQTGMQVSLLSIGGSPLGGFYGESDDEAVHKDVIVGALREGLNFIDTAPWYGNSEVMLGKILRDVPRSAYYLATKVGRYEPAIERMFDFRAERVLRSVEDSLARLGTDYVDLIQVHDVEFSPDPRIIVEETLPALEKVVASGKARHIGITGYALDALRAVIDASPVRIETVLSYCRLMPSDHGLVRFARAVEARGVGVINASSLGMGLYTSAGPPDWHPASPELKAACRQAAIYCAEQGVSIEKLALAHALAYTEYVVRARTHVVGMRSAAELVSNLACATEPLTAHEQACLGTMVDMFAIGGPHHWEGAEPEKYFRKLGGRARILRDVYGRDDANAVSARPGCAGECAASTPALTHCACWP